MPVDPADLFQSQLPLIEGVIRSLVRRRQMAAAEAEEFASHVRLKLIEGDYHILRQFRERSSLGTYLSTVVGHLFQDYRNSQWGKWRPSAQARRAGELAVRLEKLLHRDGVPFQQAVEVLLVTERVAATRAEIDALRAQLPARMLGLIRFGGQVNYAVYALLPSSVRETTGGCGRCGKLRPVQFSMASIPSARARRSYAAGLIWPRVECRLRWL